MVHELFFLGMLLLLKNALKCVDNIGKRQDLLKRINIKYSPFCILEYVKKLSPFQLIFLAYSIMHNI